ncbi:MAG: methyltransferase domain-containing protein [Lentisphaerae bacterium]|nr:methyltransferase domain-containing protein [Lentisphaerota bacterium]
MIFSNNPDKDWQKFGEKDPYYGVVSNDMFHKDLLNHHALEEFFETGKDHVEYLFREIRTHVDSSFAPERALDFGCGVGRCTIPLATMCKSVVGIDVSEAMLAEARKNCGDAIDNIEWVRSDDQLSRVSGTFDFIHSFIVFQHIPEKRGQDIVTRLIDLLSSRGVAALHFLYNTELSPILRIMRMLRKKVPLLHNFANIVYGKPFTYPLMQKNVYSLNKLFYLLQKNRCGNCAVRLEGPETMQGIIILFQKKPDIVPYNAQTGN